MTKERLQPTDADVVRYVLEMTEQLAMLAKRTGEDALAIALMHAIKSWPKGAGRCSNGTEVSDPIHKRDT